MGGRHIIFFTFDKDKWFSKTQLMDYNRLFSHRGTKWEMYRVEIFESWENLNFLSPPVIGVVV